MPFFIIGGLISHLVYKKEKKRRKEVEKNEAEEDAKKIHAICKNDKCIYNAETKTWEFKSNSEEIRKFPEREQCIEHCIIYEEKRKRREVGQEEELSKSKEESLQGWHNKIAKTSVIKRTKKPLILLITLSIFALILILLWWATLPPEGINDFSYLEREATTINSIRERISQQPLDYCCSQLPSKEISNLLKEIPAKSPSKGIKTSEQIFEEFSKAIVVVGGENSYGEFGFGSGFIISPSGLFVTNYHVIEDMGNLAVALTGEELRILDVKSIIAKDVDKDIVVLKAEGQKLPYVFMGNSDLAKVGQRVFALGSPEGYTNTISDGIVSQIREFKAGIKSIQITTPTSQGSSGGALFNDKGEVIGITDSGDWYGQNINFAIPVNYVKELLGIK